MDANNILNIKLLKFDTYTEYYLVLDLKETKSRSDIEMYYNRLMELVSREKIRIVFEKVFGLVSFKNQYRLMQEQYREKYGIERYPVTYIQGLPVSDTPLSGITVYGISTDNEQISVSYYLSENRERALGTKVRINGAEYLYLCGLHSTQSAAGDAFSQTFNDLSDHLKQNGYPSESMVRTWIYLKDIHENYIEFNQARRLFFEQNQIDYSAKSSNLPASTCIEGRTADESMICMDVYCLKSSGSLPRTERIYNKLQNEAEGVAYKNRPTFSRGKAVLSRESTEIQISGTASINETGQTVFLNDGYRQIKKTLENVKNLLDQYQMDFSDLCYGTCFFKNKEDFRHLESVLREMNISGLDRCAYVIGNVCRDDLLFELDGVARRK